jgi:acetylornithine deacetylase/succinyl-diaminopimelate desuccinylase-like protein
MKSAAEASSPVSAPTAPRNRGALGLIRELAVEIGPRRPCSEAEKRAAERLEHWLRQHGVEAWREPFRGYESFGQPYSLIMGAAVAGAILQRRGHKLGSALSLASLAIASLEGELRTTPLSDLLSRRPSVNVLGRVPAAGERRRTVCLVGHLDTTRSGLIFHPAATRHLRKLLMLPAVSGAVLAAGPLLRRIPGGKALQNSACLGMAASLALLAERELRGQDVPGASDNASGAAVAAQLAAECAAQPLAHTEVRLLITSCEESGLLGAQAYVRAHADEAAETTFFNFDTVGGDVPLTYIRKEGGPARFWPASPNLVELAEALARRRPDLRLEAAPSTPGLPTDATVFRARGWEAITFLAQSEQGIPNYHLPTDTFEHISADAITRALETGREMLRELDRAG